MKKRQYNSNWRKIHDEMPGTRFGRLVVIRRQGTTRHGGVKWLCRCDCGAEMCLKSWCEAFGLNADSIYTRAYKTGIPHAELLERAIARKTNPATTRREAFAI